MVVFFACVFIAAFPFMPSTNLLFLVLWRDTPPSLIVKGEESSANRIALDKEDGKKAKASSNSAQVLSMPVAVVPRRRYGTDCIRWRIRCENVRSEE